MPEMALPLADSRAERVCCPPPLCVSSICATQLVGLCGALPSSRPNATVLLASAGAAQIEGDVEDRADLKMCGVLLFQP